MCHFEYSEREDRPVGRPVVDRTMREERPVLDEGRPAGRAERTFYGEGRQDRPYGQEAGLGWDPPPPPAPAADGPWTSWNSSSTDFVSI